MGLLVAPLPWKQQQQLGCWQRARSCPLLIHAPASHTPAPALPCTCSVYKNFDPRAKIIRGVAEEVFTLAGRDPLIEVAIALQDAALAGV